MKPIAPPRVRSPAACFCLRSSCSRSRRFCSSRLRFSFSFSAFASARRAERDVAGDGDLGAVLGARLGVALGGDSAVAGALTLLLFAGAALGLALCAALGHRG